ncbi:cytochrome P450 [Macrolepiota fuliginosa MF-IS2]|uniref:Cytochrome P450 n=1 Tax=Macrolepiota fuliginosa MF-IS2 TaxID=1400762 RepID=A0A9P5XMY1_9AGAR|nr:cytochrome P450 [Macrolepiota fuliginosa MF-IS2]
MASLLANNLDITSLIVRLSGASLAVYAALRYAQAKRSPLNSIPTVGHSGVFSSYVTAFQWIQNAGELIQEGYDRYPGQAFKVATLSRWLVILNGKQHVDDVRKATDDDVSFLEATEESIPTTYTFGQRFLDDAFHIVTVRSPITRNLISRFGDITDEVVEAFNDYIPPTKDWTAVPAYQTLMHIVCRVSNRYFVGLPLCREPGYRSLNETFTTDLANMGRTINCFPKFLRPLVGRCMSLGRKNVDRMLQYLGPTIEARVAQMKQPESDRGEVPNDLITWLIETATQDYQLDARDLAKRILAINFAAIHTSSMSITQGVYDLAIHPEYIKELREEAESVIEEYGWTKGAMQKMRKVDSFLKESQRLNSLGKLLMTRKTLRNWTLSDGTLIPAGSHTAVATHAMHKDESLWEDADTFKGSRFAEMREGDGELDSIKHQMVSLSFDQIVFGHGRHACPGRFFAVNEIKAMFVHILLTYDIQFEDGSMERPPNIYFEAAIIPNPRATVFFKKRSHVA